MGISQSSQLCVVERVIDGSDIEFLAFRFIYRLGVCVRVLQRGKARTINAQVVPLPIELEQHLKRRTVLLRLV